MMRRPDPSVRTLFAAITPRTVAQLPAVYSEPMPSYEDAVFPDIAD